jgi:four helix bundle protein
MKGEEGYKKLVIWRNARKLRALIYQLTSTFPKAEFRRVSQMRDAARSVKQNIQEGYQRRSLNEYIRGLEVSRASLAELKGDLEDSQEDGLITPQEFSDADNLYRRTDYLFTRLVSALDHKRRTESSAVGKR